MERGAYRQNASICRCFPERPCARGRYYLCERSVFGAVLARGVGNPLRPRSVIPCAKGRYPLRERSAFPVRKVCIFEALTADSCVSGRYSCGEASTRSRPCVRGSIFGLIAMGLFRIARKLCIDPFAAPFAGVSPAAAIAQSLRERSVLIGVLA